VVLKQAASAPDSGDSTIAIARRLFNLDRELKKPGHEEKAAERPTVPGPDRGSETKSPCR
jgi:hypothetical protein